MKVAIVRESDEREQRSQRKKDVQRARMKRIRADPEMSEALRERERKKYAEKREKGPTGGARGSKDRGQKLQRKRELQRERLKRIKADPEKLEALREMERKKYAKRKARGQIRKVTSMTEEERLAFRERANERKRGYRMKQKLERIARRQSIAGSSREINARERCDASCSNPMPSQVRAAERTRIQASTRVAVRKPAESAASGNVGFWRPWETSAPKDLFYRNHSASALGLLHAWTELYSYENFCSHFDHYGFGNTCTRSYAMRANACATPRHRTP